MPESLDHESILAHVAHLRRAVSALMMKGAPSADAIATSTELLWFIAYGLQTAIQNVIDIAMQVTVALSGDAPEDYRSSIEALGRLGVLDPVFARKIAPMAGLRNVLVHGYLELDARRLADALTKLDDLTVFADTIVRFLSAHLDV